MSYEKFTYICTLDIRQIYETRHIKNQIINFMKNFKHYLFAVATLVLGVCLASCGDDPINEKPGTGTGTGNVNVDVSVASVEPGGATIDIVSEGIREIAYIEIDSELPASAIFAGGEVKTIADPAVETTTSILITGKEVATTYTYYFAFRESDNDFYGEVVKVEFTTTDYEGTLTVVDRRYDGFAVHVVVPAEVKARGNALRYTTTSLPFYNYSKSEGSLEIDMLLYNAQQYTIDDKTIRYDEENSYERDEDGNIVENGASYSDPKVPGEPGIFLIGEYSYMDDPDELVVYMDGEVSVVSVPENDPNYLDYATHAIWSYPAGWQAGYYMPVFDWAAWANESGTDAFDSEKYWSGYYERIQVNTLEPEQLDGGVEIKTYDLRPIDGIISFTPTENVAFYNVMIMEESEYQVNILPLLDNNEEYLRWFTGSYFALYTFGSQVLSGDSEIYLTDWFVDTKGLAGKEIRVLCTSMGDNEGKTQAFDTYKFTMPEVTKAAPEIVVTPVESSDPYTATFNIKAPNKDAYEVYFACDYVREFDAALKNTTYLALMKSMGAANQFGSAEISAINSAAGLNFTVASRENATTRLVVLVYNDEGTNNNLNATGSPAIAEYTTPQANYPVRVNSPLFDELVGEWVASAEMTAYDADAQAWLPIGETYTSDVTIAAGVEYPETLPKEVYDLYASMGVSRDATDALWEEFVELAEQYNNRTRGFNRLLCLGYDLTDPTYMLDLVATPYDLFTADDYSSSKVSHMFYDFGPKWNLEIDAEGNVWLPINIEREFPLETFNFGMEYTFYMLGVGQKSYIGAPVYREDGSLLLDSRFPVEVSADRNTITIKPIIYNYKDAEGKDAQEIYYPCVTQLQYGQATPTSPRVGSDVVLTRKDATRTATKANASVATSEAPAVKSLGKAPVPMQRTYSITPVRSIEIKEYERVIPERKIESGSEAFHRRAKELIKKTYGIELE